MGTPHWDQFSFNQFYVSCTVIQQNTGSDSRFWFQLSSLPNHWVGDGKKSYEVPSIFLFSQNLFLLAGLYYSVAKEIWNGMIMGKEEPSWEWNDTSMLLTIPVPWYRNEHIFVDLICVHKKNRCQACRVPLLENLIMTHKIVWNGIWGVINRKVKFLCLIYFYAKYIEKSHGDGV